MQATLCSECEETFGSGIHKACGNDVENDTVPPTKWNIGNSRFSVEHHKLQHTVRLYILALTKILPVTAERRNDCLYRLRLFSYDM